MVFQQGDHVCTLYTTPEQQLTAAIEYIRGGLSRGERCFYVCCEHEPDQFRAALKQGGIDVEAEEARGAILLATKHDGHLEGGKFDPDKMIALLDKAVKDALAAGFTGLCAAGDMTWVLDAVPGTERLAEYEARLNRFYEASHALGLCLYNLKTMSPAAIDHCLATHKFVRIEGPILLSNPFYELPEQAFSRTAQPDKVAAKIKQIYSVA
jgi:DcmR-like sensory protein